MTDMMKVSPPKFGPGAVQGPDMEKAFATMYRDVLSRMDLRYAKNDFGGIGSSGQVLTSNGITDPTWQPTGLPNIPNDTVIGNVSGSTGTASALTEAQLTTLINAFTSTKSGAVPPSGGGTSTFLRADATFDKIDLASAVTGQLPLANISSIGADTVLGNATAGSTAPSALTQTQLTALINLATASLSGAAPPLSGVATQFLNGTGAYSVPAYPTGANPTASVGLAAVNGSAATFMRSDGAPALSQSISPTWTAAHIFTPGSGVGITVNGNNASYALQVVNGGGSAASLSGAAGVSALLEIAGNGNTLGTASMAVGQSSSGSSTVLARGSQALSIGNGNGTLSFGSSTGAGTFSKAIGVNNTSPPAQVTGWGTPTSPAVVANFSGTAATTAQIQSALAKIITDLKAIGFYAA